MNALIRFFTKQHTFVNLTTIFIISLGLYSAAKIRREAFPNIDFGIITITTNFPNASASSVEQLITIPLESKLKQVEGVEQMTSYSIEGSSTITLKLDPDLTTQEEAKSASEDAVSSLTDLPEQATNPRVTSRNTKTQSIILLALSGIEDLTKLRSIAKQFKTKIENLSGVATASYQGFPSKEITIETNPEELNALKVTLTEVIDTLKTANINIPAGIFLSEGPQRQEFVVKTVSEADQVSSIEQLVIRSNIVGTKIRIKDIANVKSGFKEQEIIYRNNGERSINLSITKKSSADTIRTVSSVKALVKKLALTYDKSLKAQTLNDRSKRVHRRVNVLTNNIAIGLVMVLIILSIVLPIRVALITALGIPFAFLGTLLIFDHAGVSLNLISMTGLIIVLGMVVDDAIVVTENAQRRMDQGEPPLQAAMAGTTEIWQPVTTSVLTTIAAFLPLMFMSGIFGKFVRNIPIGVILALSISLLECLFILPSHIAEWSAKKSSGSQSRIANFWDLVIVARYQNILKTLIRFRYIFVTVIYLGAIVSVMFAMRHMPYVFFTGTKDQKFTIQLEEKLGTPIDNMEVQVKHLESYILETYGQTHIEAISSTIGKQKGRGHGRHNSKVGSHYANLTVYLKSPEQGALEQQELIAKLQSEYTPPNPDLKLSFTKGRTGPPVGKSFSLQLISNDPEDMLAAAKAVKNHLKKISGVNKISDSLVDGKKQIIVKLDDQKISQAQLSKQQIALTVQAALDGVVADQLQKFDEQVDLRITLPAHKIANKQDLKNIKVANKQGTLVSLSQVATILEGRSTGSYQHLDGLRLMRVEAEVDEGVLTSRALNKKMGAVIKDLQSKWTNIDFRLGGEEQDRKKSFRSLLIAFGFSVFCIILLLILQFNNIYQPFIIVSMIPLGLLSVIWTFYAHNEPLSFLALVGMISLGGIIVNNAIVFIDFYNHAKLKGLEQTQAIYDAAKKRLRPIVLTSATTVAGIMPTAYGIGGYDRFILPIALALGWGVLAGSVLTCFVLPPLIQIFDDIKSLIKNNIVKNNQNI